MSACLGDDSGGLSCGLAVPPGPYKYRQGLPDASDRFCSPASVRVGLAHFSAPQTLGNAHCLTGAAFRALSMTATIQRDPSSGWGLPPGVLSRRIGARGLARIASI